MVSFLKQAGASLAFFKTLLKIFHFETMFSFGKAASSFEGIFRLVSLFYFKILLSVGKATDMSQTVFIKLLKTFHF